MVATLPKAVAQWHFGPASISSMCAQLCTDFGAGFHSAGWCEGSGVSRRAPRELGALSSWQTLIPLTGTFRFSLVVSNTSCDARMGMLVFLQSFHPRE